MKKNIRSWIACAALAAAGTGASLSLMAAEAAPAKAPAAASIRAAGKIAKADLPGLAKISFCDALKIAATTVPGSVISGELEVEEGNLQYSFDVVGADKSITEVEIDAGNGKVLDTDKDEPGKEDKD
jgi:uncharacterized membrane protein YkoI